MSAIIINLALQLVSGAAGGFVFARLTGFTLGRIGDAVSGAIGGAIGGQLLQSLIPALAGGGGFDIVSVLGNLAVGGVSGAILAVIAGLLVNPIEY
ncbi:hypothetical protein RZS28_08365 [Methylocapsa polymorpha]|uniref:Transglycosylase associated protein n=1 Tax=Methylocapsa polymorpha TaxID=3080828 RepID=A0ABZ0HZD8_9HYPH|nr:hypothetical protein RZS28_08365 [Methylocapsa sp. RX1]